MRIQPTDADYDVIVIGARIAGSIAASLLADGGHRVLVLDRATFPSDTISTHFFRTPALRAFARMGVFDELQAAAPHLTVNYNAMDGVVFPEPIDRSEENVFHMNVRRITLDDILVRRIRGAGNVEVTCNDPIDEASPETALRFESFRPHTAFTSS